jgi:uroporphyrinogen decarboxylase
MHHTSPDRPPIDLGATTLTGMRMGLQQRLIEFLGLSGEPERSNSGVDERILRWAGTDFRGIGQIIELPSTYTRQISPTIAIDCWGVQREFMHGEWQITHSPLRGSSREDLKSFQWPAAQIKDSDLINWENRAKALHQDDRFVVVAEHPVYGIMELGCWMCGYDDFLMRLAGDQDFVRDFFDRVLSIQLTIIDEYYSVLGPYIDLTTSGDDFGMQLGPLLSPRQFASLVAPYFAERIQRTKQIARCYYWHHTCGSVVELLDQIIACGVDILNPIQTSAEGMNPLALKTRFGERLVFWGAVDVQKLLPCASSHEVAQEVHSLVDILGNKGGYVSAPAHEMQDDIPPENVVAWVESVKSAEGKK